MSLRCCVSVLLIALAACASTPKLPPDGPVTPTTAPSTLGPGDVFEVRVYGEQELTGVYRVSTDGSISFPLVGSIDVAGLSPKELNDELTGKLAKYINRPHVSVFVKEYNSKKVYVLGKVRQPGTFPFEDGMSIIQAITLSGGFDSLASENGTYVTRIVEGQEVRTKVPVKDIGEGKAPNFVLEPGDIVYVPESIF